MEICKLFPDREKWENYPKKIQFGIPNWLPTAMHGISGGETSMDRLHIAIALGFFYNVKFHLNKMPQRRQQVYLF